ncbi:FAD-dependent oxidoreductase [Methylocystis iwaonis]|uniref:FAD-dependent oxidoreductase n=1 Tax=Methylocystis iwaonis TaxID=2885079 RepID=UPI002E7ADB81|nr:FAD-dependent oxidoreductase [Methylocystis iwaonis]
MLTRRQTMRLLGAAALAPSRARAEADYRIGAWTGDSFAPMHAIRDGLWDRPAPAPERRVEVAIVGGGLAGLAAATLLRDRDILLLERETEPGGAAKSGRWRDIDYALGSAYFVDVAEPFGPFYDALGLTPRPVPQPENRVIANGSADAIAGPLHEPFARLRGLVEKLVAGPDLPKTPIEAAPSAALALDRLTLRQFLLREQIDPALLPYLDAFSRSAMGAPAAEVSAYVGLNFLSELAGRIYAFPGGNAALAKAMAARVSSVGAGRIVTGAAVFAVEPSGDGGEARVAWFDAENPGEPRCVAAKWVVFAAPFFFAARILRGIDPAAKAAMTRLRQGSFLVANCCFEGALAPGAFDCWTPEAESVTDAVDAGAALGERRPKDHGVLTVYAPFKDPRLGRAQLLAGDGAALAEPIVAELRRFLPEVFSGTRLTEVRLTRWGHHHLIPAPGIVGTMRALPKRYGNVLLAHSDGQGMPAVESAITEAHRAAAIIKGE